MTPHLKICFMGAGATVESFLKSLEQHAINTKNSTEPLNLTFIVRNIEKIKNQLNEMYNPNFCDNITFININQIEQPLEFDLLFCGIPAKEMANQENVLNRIRAKTVLDINYSSDIYNQCSMQICGVYISGLELLMSQAMYGFEHFFGYKPDFKIPNQNDKIDTIMFTGFSGSGKSTLGKELASKIDAEYFDTDSMIEAENGMTISDIFTTYGEKYFRELEAELILKIIARKGKKIISLGGGTSLISLKEKLKNSRIIWLYSDLQNCINRINITEKPILKNLSTSEIEALFLNRQELYFNNADAIVLNQGNKNIIEQLYAEISISLKS